MSETVNDNYPAIDSREHTFQMTQCALALRRAFRFSVVLCAILPPLASASDFGYLWVCTVKPGAKRGDPGTFVKGVIIGVYKGKRHGESFTISDQTGYAMIPLRPGSYCAEAYGTNGRRLILDKGTNHGEPFCFDIVAHQVKEAGITIAYDEDYKPDFPSKGVD